METQPEKRLTDMTGGEDWEGRMYGKSKLETDITYVK